MDQSTTFGSLESLVNRYIINQYLKVTPLSFEVGKRSLRHVIIEKREGIVLMSNPNPNPRHMRSYVLRYKR
jgi:hypothetical protein